MLGLRHGENYLVPYTDTWVQRYALEREQICAALQEAILAIEHVGSTAVPGLSAKPIIDILIEVSDLAAIDALNGDMETVGYEPKGEFGIPGRRYFQKGGDERTHHVHAFVSGDSNVTRHIAFSDYLRANPAVSKEYADLKKR